MSDLTFGTYIASTKEEFIREKMKGEGLERTEAEGIASEAYSRLIPDGQKSKDQLFFEIKKLDLSETIGFFWVCLRGTKAFIYDINLHEQFRNQGYGQAALVALEKLLKSLGATEVSLHVFGHNTRAQKLYLKQGFQITNLNMRKML